MRAEAINAIAGKATQLGQSLLESLGLLLDGKVRVENSKYAAHYLQRLNQLPEGSVLNSSDIMTSLNGQDMVDEKIPFECYLDIGNLDSVGLQWELRPCRT